MSVPTSNHVRAMPKVVSIALRERACRKQNVVGCSALLTYTRGRPGLAEKDALDRCDGWEIGDRRWKMEDGERSPLRLEERQEG